MKDELKDKILKNAPKVTDKIIKKANDMLPGYLFYESTENKDGRRFYCSKCNSTFKIQRLQRTTIDLEYDALTANHNESGICPHCKSEVQFKNIGKSKSCKSLRQHINIAWFVPISYDEVYIVCFALWKDYRYKKNNNFNTYIDNIYHITPERSKQYETGYYDTSSFYEISKIKEPFCMGYMHGYECYKLIGFDKIDKTFLKYSGYKEYISRLTCKYLALYPTHKPFEMMVKLGLKNFITEVIYYNRENKRLIDWNATKAQDIFKMSKQEFNEMRRLNFNVEELKDYKVFRKIQKITMEESKSITRELYIANHNEIIKIIKKFNIKPKELTKYIEKNHKKLLGEMCHNSYYPGKSAVWITWTDYINMAIFLNYDLSQKIVMFPKDLTKSHDIAAEIMNRKKEEERLRQEAEKNEQRRKELEAYELSSKKLYKKRVKQYAYENEQFAIIVPKKLEDIIREGQLMQHCVGGYAERHAKGKTTILFLRDKSEIDKPLYTIEMWDKDLRQVQGFKNQTPLTSEAQVFFDEWLEYVKNGSKTNKKATAQAVA